MAKIVINEIHYHPDVKTEWAEFIELHNSGATAVDLSGWRISGGVAFTIPNSTSIAPGGYVVIAQDPPTVLAKFGAAALGPWSGRLDNEGDSVSLVNAAGGVEDEVDYQLGFPWPTVGDSPGYSVELANPAFDNSLGGNWRASVVGNPANGTQPLIETQSTWRYFKGLAEASSPTTEWRKLSFDDRNWLSGRAPIGYDPSLAMGTPLNDMRGFYTSVFFRNTFVVSNVAEISSLLLEALYDDGFKLWINEHPIRDGAFNLPAGEIAFDATAGSTREDNSSTQFILDSAQNFLIPGTNIIAVQAANIYLSDSSDFFLDLRLLARTGAPDHGPTPGALNSVSVSTLPPQIRQVDHSPKRAAHRPTGQHRRQSHRS